MKDFFIELKNELNLYKMCIIKIILGIYSYSSILTIIGTEKNYNFFLLLGCIAIIYMYLKLSIDKKVKKVSIFISVVVSLLISVGHAVETSIALDNLNIFSIMSLFKLLIIFCGLFVFFYYVFNYFFSHVKSVNLLVKNDRFSPNKVFFACWVLIFLLWLPYFLRFFPGIMTMDSRVQLSYIEEVIFKNNHPFVQTWFEGGIYNLGKLLFNNSNLAMGFYTLIQMLILSAIFAYAVRFLYKYKFKPIIVVLVLLAYGLLPQFTIYSVTIWKDVLFGGAMLLLLITLAEMTLSEHLKFSNMLLFILACLMILFFRNNGVYILMVCFPFWVYCFRKKIKIILPVLVGLFAVYFVVTGPIYNYLKVEKPDSVESLAIPLQQVGRVIASDGEMNKNEREYLQSIFNFAEIKDIYSPYIVDPVKNHANRVELSNTKNQFFSVWLTLFLKNPDTYIEAYLSQTLGYWYPSVKYWTVGSPYRDSYNIYNINLLPNFLTKVIDSMYSTDYSLSVLCWGIGLGFLMLLLSVVISYIRKIEKEKYIAWFIPFFGLWLTMMLASPVYAEYRYVYGLFTSLPIIILMPFLKNKIISKKK